MTATKKVEGGNDGQTRSDRIMDAETVERSVSGISPGEVDSVPLDSADVLDGMRIERLSYYPLGK